MYEVCEGVWCLVGNGLSNQTFVRGPEGIIAIDTGESVEEMRSALDHLRRVTTEPVVGVTLTRLDEPGDAVRVAELESLFRAELSTQ